MKIGFDGKRAVNNMTGLGNYSRLVIEQLAQHSPDDELIVYAPSPRENPRLELLKKLSNVSFRFPQKREARFGKSMWRTIGLPYSIRKDQIQIFHGLSNELPLNIRKAGIPSIVTIHDVIYRTMPQCYKAIDRRIYDFKYGNSARNATAVIAISECTKRDIMRFYGIDEQKIHLIYQDCHPSFRITREAAPTRESLAKYDLPQQYLIQVGTIELRKNALLSVQALSALKERFPDLKLLLVGRATAYHKEVMQQAVELNVADRVITRSDIPFKDLPALVHHAFAALYPSRYEGFGLPVLESLNAGTPTIAATGSCLEEAGGDAAIYVNPDDAKALSQAIESILTNPDKAAEMRAKGIDHARRFTQYDMASAIHELYEQLLRK